MKTRQLALRAVITVRILSTPIVVPLATESDASGISTSGKDRNSSDVRLAWPYFGGS
jgi:hypothetical protein